MVDFPFHDTVHSKPRPAVVIQADMVIRGRRWRDSVLNRLSRA